jgi:hypothetical protein
MSSVLSLFSVLLFISLACHLCLAPSYPTSAAGAPRVQTPIRVASWQSTSRCMDLLSSRSQTSLPLLTVFFLQVEALNKAIQESLSSQKLRHVMHICLLLGTNTCAVLLSSRLKHSHPKRYCVLSAYRSCRQLPQQQLSPRLSAVVPCDIAATIARVQQPPSRP